MSNQSIKYNTSKDLRAADAVNDGTQYIFEGEISDNSKLDLASFFEKGNKKIVTVKTTAKLTTPFLGNPDIENNYKNPIYYYGFNFSSKGFLNGASVANPNVTFLTRFGIDGYSYERQYDKKATNLISSSTNGLNLLYNGDFLTRFQTMTDGGMPHYRYLSLIINTETSYILVDYNDANKSVRVIPGETKYTILTDGEDYFSDSYVAADSPVLAVFATGVSTSIFENPIELTHIANDFTAFTSKSAQGGPIEENKTLLRNHIQHIVVTGDGTSASSNQGCCAPQISINCCCDCQK